MANENCCFLCGDLCDEEDYCYGCSQYVCDNCDQRPSGDIGVHDVYDHDGREDDDEDEDDGC